MSNVISLEEAARRTGLTRRQIGDKVAKRELTIERDPVTGEKGIYPHTLRGVNGYQPPEPHPPPKPPPPLQPAPEPWIPGSADMAALIKLDDRGRAVRIADLVRQHPHLQAWFRDNPLPPVYRKPQPPPPPPPEPSPVWQTSWQFDFQPSWETQPKPPEPVPPQPQPRQPAPQPKPPVLPVTPPAPSESVGRLIMNVLWLALTGLARNLWISLEHLVRTRSRLAVAVVATTTFVGVYYMAQAYFLKPSLPPPFVYHPAPQHVFRVLKHHHAPPANHHGQHPTVPSPSPRPLPPLLPPGAGRQTPVYPG